MHRKQYRLICLQSGWCNKQGKDYVTKKVIFCISLSGACSYNATQIEPKLFFNDCMSDFGSKIRFPCGNFDIFK